MGAYLAVCGDVELMEFTTKALPCDIYGVHMVHNKGTSQGA